MSIKNKMENWILNKSKSYQFYKDYYEKNNNDKNNPQIEKQLKKIKKDFKSFKTQTDAYMDSSTYLLRTLLVDYDINEPKDILKYIHELSNELLILISNICNKKGIEWWLDSSSLLGAVRHGGYIPWDDEVDIGMIRKDYLEFNKIIDDEIDNLKLNDILTVDFKNNENNFKSFIQITIKGKTLINDEDSIFAVLNVIPYDYMEKFNKKTIKKDFKNSRNSYFNNLEKLGRDSSLKKHYEELNLSLNPANYIISGVDGNEDINIFKSDQIFPLNTISFGENIFYSPKNVHYYLKRMYKDYLILPRIVSIHDRVDSFRYNTNNDELFGKYINRLSDANLKFKN